MLEEIQSDWPLVYILNETYASEFYLLGIRTVLCENCAHMTKNNIFLFLCESINFYAVKHLR